MYIHEIGEDDTHAFRLLCGSERGRALRDQIIHQTNIRLDFLEYKKGSDKEKLFIILGKENFEIPYKEFMIQFIIEVLEMVSCISSRIILDESNNKV